MSAPQPAPVDLTMEIVDAVGDAFNRNDTNAVMACFTEDAIFDNVAGPDVHGQRFAGKDAIRAAFQGLFDRVEVIHWAPRDIRIVGDKAYCEFQRTATLKTGEKQDWYAFDILTFRDGLIVHKDSYYKIRS